MRKLNKQQCAEKLSPYLDLPLDMILWEIFVRYFRKGEEKVFRLQHLRCCSIKMNLREMS